MQNTNTWRLRRLMLSVSQEIWFIWFIRLHCCIMMNTQIADISHVLSVRLMYLLLNKQNNKLTNFGIFGKKLAPIWILSTTNCQYLMHKEGIQVMCFRICFFSQKTIELISTLLSQMLKQLFCADSPWTATIPCGGLWRRRTDTPTTPHKTQVSCRFMQKCPVLPRPLWTCSAAKASLSQIYQSERWGPCLRHYPGLNGVPHLLSTY